MVGNELPISGGIATSAAPGQGWSMPWGKFGRDRIKAFPVNSNTLLQMHDK